MQRIGKGGEGGRKEGEGRGLVGKRKRIRGEVYRIGAYNCSSERVVLAVWEMTGGCYY